MTSTEATADATLRKRRGAWYTPAELVDLVVAGVLDDLQTGFRSTTGRPLRIVDPACGDGRFLAAVGAALGDRGYEVHATGADLDADALAHLPAGTDALHIDSLAHAWDEGGYDIVVGNPPFLSQMATTTTRGGSSRHGGGPYADAAVEFLALAVRLAHPDGGCVGLVLPQSILGARDAGPVREGVDGMAVRTWSWWSADQRLFDANVNVCALGFRRTPSPSGPPGPWTAAVTDVLGIPALAVDRLEIDGTVGDRADLNANFRDEYYALVDAVADDADGPPLVTSRLIDPGRCTWGERTVRFAKRDFEHPRVDLSRLHGRFVGWADRKLVPKVLVANQTRMIEAVADPEGAWLPGVPVTSVTPTGDTDVLELAAVLTSPIASAWCWFEAAGTGLSARTIRLGPALLATVPWPAGDLGPAVDALRRGDVIGCGAAVTAASGIDDDGSLLEWWCAGLPD